ncbi:MAG: Crp/Fnr family transcriptional regulator [Mycobacterium sp.]
MQAPSYALATTGCALQEWLTPDWRHLVLASEFMVALGTEAAADLMDRLTLRVLLAGSLLFTAGDDGDRLYIVLEGRLQVFRSDDHERARMLEILGPGAVVGELSMFGATARTATSAALSHAKVAELEYPAVKRVLRDHPEANLRILGHMAERLRKANEIIADHALLNVRSRVLKAVVELAPRFGRVVDEGIIVEHGLSQEDLARYVGSSREMVNRALSDLQNRGIVVVRPRSLILTRRRQVATQDRQTGLH